MDLRIENEPSSGSTTDAADCWHNLATEKPSYERRSSASHFWRPSARNIGRHKAPRIVMSVMSVRESFSAMMSTSNYELLEWVFRVCGINWTKSLLCCVEMKKTEGPAVQEGGRRGS